MDSNATMNTSELHRRLTREITGEVLTDPMSLGLYATDASMYQVTPLAVAVPRNRRDLLQAVRIAGELGVPILPRGAGTSLTGQAVGRAVVIDTSKYMNQILELNPAERWARVEPGLVRDELNARIREHRLHFAPDPATSNRASIGGMISNNSGGMRSIRYGMTQDHLISVDLALSTGEVLNLGPIDAEQFEAKCALQDREGEIYRGFLDIIDANRDEIDARYPRVHRNSTGYLLKTFAGGLPWNMAHLLCASEGTLGMILEAKVALEPVPVHSGLILAHFTSIPNCLASVAHIVAHGPSAVELMDGIIITRARSSLLTREIVRCVQGDPAAVLVIEAQADDPAEVRATLEAIVADLTARKLGYALPVMLDPAEIAQVWEMRAAALGLMTTVRGDRKPVPYMEDAAVPLENLPAYIDDVLAITAQEGLTVSLFAHASVGLLHIRPMHDLHDPAALEQVGRVQEAVFEACMKHGGAWSGEHGDGLVRGRFIERMYGPRLNAAFAGIKQLFDPPGLMNLGKIVKLDPWDENLRLGAGYTSADPPTFFHWRDEQGLRRAVEQCTGVGACRKTLGGTMCPSYIATRDEEHSTRGRANALRLAMGGRLEPGALASDRLLEVMDLCLACKGCRKECPNNVDMARMKSEVLQWHHDRHGVKPRAWLMSRPDLLGRLAAGPQAELINTVLGLETVRRVMQSLTGMDARRPLPRYARRRFSHWFERRQPIRWPEGRTVALFVDTWLEYHEPRVGRAAVEVLEAAGFRVELARAGDSQRPAISKGMLRRAQARAGQVMEKLDEFARRGLPIIVCEPSCASALADDLPDLIADEARGRRVGDAVRMIDRFLFEEITGGRARLNFRGAAGAGPEILVHGHCHQKAYEGMGATLGLLRMIPGATVRETGAGCCGMAGSFGYEAEHYDISVKVAEDRLLPAIAATPRETLIVANGFSCRHQIADLAQRKTLHTVELMRRFIKLS